MRKSSALVVGALVVLGGVWSCTSHSGSETGSISKDSTSIALGSQLFEKNCGSCHSVKLEGIGPALGGLPRFLPADWMFKFIKDPKVVIESGDARAQRLIVKYNIVMPSFGHLKDEEINNVIAYLNSQKPPDSLGAESNLMGSANPITEPIPPADLEVELKLFAQFPTTGEKTPLARITKLDYQPGSGKLFVVDLNGKLYSLIDGKPAVYMDISKLRPAFIDKPGLATGFGSFAFHPDFLKNGLLYTSHTEGKGTATADFVMPDSVKVMMQGVLMEWKTKQPAAGVFTGEGREILRVDMTTQMHGFQEIAFNPNAKPGSKDYGLLYLGIGDGGGVESGYPYLVHSPDKIWGSVVRIDPAGKNSNNTHYGIPPDNPFSKLSGPAVVKEIYASGFRNPHRITWTGDGQMLVSNIGHNHIESLNLVKPGNNFGWPIREGTFSLDPKKSMSKIYDLPLDDSVNHFTYPIAEYDHDEGKAISGGYEYGGTIAALKGKFLFGDIPGGRLFYVETKAFKSGKPAPIKKWTISVGGESKTLLDLCGPGRVDVHLGKDRQGELYVLTKADGKVYKLVGAKAIVPK